MDNTKVIEEIFNNARSAKLQYLYSLVRVGPMDSYKVEPLKELKKSLSEGKITSKEIESSEAFWGLVTNLSRIAGGYPYNPYVFFASETQNYLEEAKKLVRIDLGEFLGKLFQDKTDVSPEQIDFITKFLLRYEEELMHFKKEPQYTKLAGFEVLELLVNNKGLFGFKIHFSNGSNAEYKRLPNHTQTINLTLDARGVGYFVGDTGSMRQEWRIGDKRLYEIGLFGRYNNPGEWMPIVYPGESGHLQKEALEASEDERIQGVVFYMLCTGHRVIEFVAKMSVKLPDEHTVLANKIHLLHVPQLDERGHEFSNEFVYDGWYSLDDTNVETIKNGLDSIQRAIEGIAFAFDNPVKWKVKYAIKGHSRGAGKPNKKDMAVLNKLVTNADTEKNLIIDTAISWYQLGFTTENKFNAFLCFHIALEGLAIKLADGKLKSSQFFSLNKENKGLRKKRVKETFDKYYASYYTSDLEKLIKDSYFEGIGSIKFHLKRAMEAVFGKDNPVIAEYFDGKESIWALRGELAHGEYSDWHFEKYMRVWNKMWRVQEIAKAFITRVLLQIPPGEKRPTWSGLFSMSMGMDRPTGTLVTTRLDMFPIKDWKIKAEWIE